MTRVGFDGTWTGTQDVDIKTIGGSLIPYGKLPVNATCSTVHTDAVAASNALGDAASNTQNFWIDTTGTMLYYPSMNFGYNGSDWDRLRTSEAMSGGTIDTGLLAVARVPPHDPVQNDAQYTAATSTVAVWTPAGSNRFILTDFVISAKDASDVSLFDGTTKIYEFYLAANGGVVMDLQTPYISTGTSTPLRITHSSATISITTHGYEDD